MDISFEMNKFGHRLLNVRLMSFFTLIRQCGIRLIFNYFRLPRNFLKSFTDSKYADYYIQGVLAFVKAFASV